MPRAETAITGIGEDAIALNMCKLMMWLIQRPMFLTSTVASTTHGLKFVLN
jgi:hypothetical protein